MLKNKILLSFLATSILAVGFLLVDNALAQWIMPPGSPGSGSIVVPLTNPLEQDLDFLDPDTATRHNIINAQNGTFSGTVQGDTVRGTNLCIGANCKNAWPGGNVTNPLTENLSGDDKFSILDLRSCSPKAGGEQCGALEVLAELNDSGDVTSFSAGVYAETIGLSGSNSSYAIYGVSNNSGGIGVYGLASAGGGWAGYFSGPLGVTGNVSINSGNVNINKDPVFGGGRLTVDDGLCIDSDCIFSWAEAGGGASYWVKNGSNIYYNDGNVGVGTNNPAEKLHVNGNLKLDGLNSEGDITNTDEIIGYNDLRLKGNSAETADITLGGQNIRAFTAGSEKFTILNNGNLGIGINNPDSKLTFAGTTGQKVHLYGTQSNGYVIGVESNELRFAGGTGATDSIIFRTQGYTGTERLRISGTGNVGIGNASPTGKLQVSGGNAYFDSNVGIGNTNATAKLQVNAASNEALKLVTGAAWSPLVIRNNADTADIFRVDQTGSLAVGAIPWARLSNYPVSCPAGQYVSGVDGTLTCSTPPGGSSQWTTLGSNIYYNTGNVGIGTTNPTVKLQVVGNIMLAGTNPSSISTTGGNDLRFVTSGSGDFKWLPAGGLDKMILHDNGTLVVPGAWNDQFVVQQTSGNVGIHNGTPSARLHVETSDLDGSTNGFRMGGRGNFYVDAPSVLGGRFALLDSGNVGIGVAAPTHKLEVAGDAYFNTPGNVIWNTGNARGRIENAYYGVQDYFSLSANFNRTSNIAGIIDHNALGTAEIILNPTNGGSGTITFSTGNVNTPPSATMTVKNGRVGVRTIDPQEWFHVQGAGRFDGQVSMNYLKLSTNGGLACNAAQVGTIQINSSTQHLEACLYIGGVYQYRQLD